MRKDFSWSWLIRVKMILTMMMYGARSAMLQSKLSHVGISSFARHSGAFSNYNSGSILKIRTFNHYNKYRTFLFSTTKDVRNERRFNALNEAINNLGLSSRIDVKGLEEAATVSSIKGYDGRFGKSAIKTYQSFLKSNKLSDENLLVDATRCARQIDFLLKRHASHDADWVRHSDDNNTCNDETKDICRKIVHPLIIVLDNVRSALNVGSIFRTADACALAMVITTGITPHPNGPGATKLAKSALGAQYILPHQHFETTQQAIEFLIQSEYHLVGLETTEHSQNLYNSKTVSFPPKTALILGNEVTGVDTQILQQMDSLVEIPMYGTKNSLNIAACAPVVLYEVLRQWNGQHTIKNDDDFS